MESATSTRDADDHTKCLQFLLATAEAESETDSEVSDGHVQSKKFRQRLRLAERDRGKLQLDRRALRTKAVAQRSRGVLSRFMKFCSERRVLMKAAEHWMESSITSGRNLWRRSCMISHNILEPELNFSQAPPEH